MAPLGTSLDASERLGLQIDKKLIAIPGVKSVIRRTGRAERDEHAEPPSNSEMEISLFKDVSMAEVKQKVDKVLDAIPGINTMIGQPIEHRLSHILSGTPAAVAINVYGADMDQLRTYAKDIETKLKKVNGARDVVANREITITTIPVLFRRNDLAQWGITMQSANEQVSAGFYGLVTDTVQDGIRQYQVVVRLKPDSRDTIDDIKNFTLYNTNGQRVYLKQVADIGIEEASNLIVRENTQRKATISCNVAEGYNLGDLITEIRKVVDPLVSKPGYYVNYGGQFEAQQEASKIIISLGAVVILLILVLLTLAFNSMKSSLLVMLNLPLALIGGVVAVYLTSGNFIQNMNVIFQGSSQQYVTPVLSIASLVGFITLFGISVRSGILLVKEYQRYQEKGEAVVDSIIKGSLERLSPILMTALTAMLALIPMAMGIGKPGSELLAPLAIVVLGGLITSTILNLLVVPAAYAWVFEPKKTQK
jgi:HME family heavy-metal exporter